MRHMQRKGYLLNLQICSQFPSHLQKEKSVDEVITKKEMQTIAKAFKEKKKISLDLFYRRLFFTGMRFNEARGLSLDNIFTGTIEDKTLKARLEEHKINYYGYIVINSQPKNKGKVRNPDGSVPRKPLKSRKKIDEKSGRIIPIADKALWRDLAKRYNACIKEYENRLYGDNLLNYIFFEDLNATSSTQLKQTYVENGIPYRNWHALRHTRSTYLVGETGDFFLARLWLGHKKQEVLEKYVHVYQAMVRSAKKKNGPKGIKPLPISPTSNDDEDPKR